MPVMVGERSELWKPPGNKEKRVGPRRIHLRPLWSIRSAGREMLRRPAIQKYVWWAQPMMSTGERNAISNAARQWRPGRAERSPKATNRLMMNANIAIPLAAANQFSAP